MFKVQACAADFWFRRMLWLFRLACFSVFVGFFFQCATPRHGQNNMSTAWLRSSWGRPVPTLSRRRQRSQDDRPPTETL